MRTMLVRIDQDAQREEMKEKDAMALAECVRAQLEDWIERGELVGDVQVGDVKAELDLQGQQVWITFKVGVRLELAREPKAD